MIKTAFFVLLRLICYPALLIVLAGVVALIVVSMNGDCPNMSERAIRCANPRSQGLADFGMAVVLASAFTGIPLLGAMGGIVFLIRDIRRLRRCFSSAPS
jgi:hypothetical protein